MTGVRVLIRVAGLSVALSPHDMYRTSDRCDNDDGRFREFGECAPGSHCRPGNLLLPIPDFHIGVSFIAHSTALAWE